MPWSLRLGRRRGPPAGLLGKPDQSLCLSPAVGCRLTPLWVPAPPELASLALGGVRQTPSEPSQKQPLRTFGALQVPPDEALTVLRVPAWRLGPRPPSQVRCVSRALDQSCPLPSWSWPQRPCEAGSPERRALGDSLRLPGPAPRSCGLSRLLRGPWGAGCLPKFPGNPLGPQSSSQLRARRAWPPPRPTVVDMLSARPVQAPGRPRAGPGQAPRGALPSQMPATQTLLPSSQSCVEHLLPRGRDVSSGQPHSLLPPRWPCRPP